MLIENEFTVPAPVDQVWKYMNDFPQVARCMPGAEITQVNGDRQVKGRVKVSMGPLKLAFAGTIDILEKNEGGHRVVMKATGSEEKGKGQASATVTSTMTPAGNGTRVQVSQDLQMSGAIAQYGRGMISDVTGALMKQFANCVAANIGKPGGGAARGAPKAMSGFSLLLISVKAFFKNLFKFGKK